MTAFPRCSRCRGLLARSQQDCWCQAYEIIEVGGYDEDAQIVWGRDMEHALERWAEKLDAEVERVQVRARLADKTTRWLAFEVDAVVSVHYRISKAVDD